MKILLLEDDLVDQMAFCRWLKKEFPHFQLEVVGNIAQTKAALQTQQFDLLVCDYLLPDGDVTDVTHFTDPKHIICISGIDDPRRLEVLKASGIQQFLFKDNQLQYLSHFKQFIAERQQQEHIVEKEFIPIIVDETQLIDLQYLKKAFDYKTQPVKEVIEVFLKHTPPLLADLEVAVKEENREICYSIAHRLKSNFQMMGLFQQIEGLQKIEHDSYNDKFEDHQHYIDLVKELNKDSIKIFALLNQELKSL